MERFTSSGEKTARAWLLLSAFAGVIGCSSNPGKGVTGDGGTGAPDGVGDVSSGKGPTDGAGQDTSNVPMDGSAGLPPEAGAKDAASTEAGAPDAGAPDSARDAPAEAGGAGPEQCVNRAPVAAKWTLQWSDEFAGSGAPDPSNWGFESGFVRNQELQWYQPNNATVSGGLLTIAAQRQQVANPNYVAGSSNWQTNRQYAEYTSSSLTSSGKRSFEYGRFEMCGQIDTALGSWPAFWILGNGRSWPSSGEVDIMEYYESNVRANVCTPAGSTCDWTGSVAQPLGNFASTWPSQFHLWAMEWDSTDIALYLDDTLVWDFDVSSISSGTNPYTGNPFYIIINQAIGANGGDPTNTTFPITYKVDYVRVYQ